MSITGLGSSAASYVAPSPPKSDESPATPDLITDGNATIPSTLVTLSGGIASEVSVYSVQPSGTPMSVTAAPELFVQADKDNDSELSLEEFTEQLKQVGVSAENAAKLFDSINTSKSKNLSLEDYVNGVASSNSNDNSVFQALFVSYTSDKDGQFSVEAFKAFRAQGASVASQYWAQHPELQQRS